ncbi:MAG: KpsF/GutQ family sugar-phosphate isomerase [Methylacidiphilales bacterium]|nr:KpsF/GutQ family sugar-phosphate isomerase [Candidatus Methylacidiphilales bacterium]
MNYLQRARLVIDIEVESLLSLKKRLDGDFNKAVELTVAALKHRNKVIVIGVGKSGHVGDKIAATLTSTGAPAVVLNALNAVHGDLGIVSKGDVVLALSYSGETEELLRILPAIKREGITLIALSGNPASTLAKNADVYLDVSVSREACPLNLAPTSSTTTMLVMGDCLAMAVLEAQGVNKDDFARFHPGGIIGRNLLLSVADVMRSLDKVSVLKNTDKVSACLQEMTAKRCGATVVVNSKGQLEGIYTHGDFVRSYQNNKDIGNMPLGKVMTQNPICVRVDKLAVEVLNIFENHRIEDLIVIDKKRKPVGLIDVQDLTRLKLL